MALSDLINVVITASTVAPTRPGFGTPLAMAYHTRFNDLQRKYPSVAALEADGFVATDAAHQLVAAIFAQNPSVQNVYLGRRALAYTQVITLVLSSASNLDKYTLTIVGSAGVSHVLDFNSTGVPATDAVSLVTAINLLSNVGTAAHTSGGTLTVTQASGKLNDYQRWNPTGSVSPIMTLQDTTTDPGIATDLAAVLASIPPGTVYGVCLDSNSQLEVAAASAFVESHGPLLFLFNNSDTICSTSSTSDIFSHEKSVAHVRTGGLFAGSQLLCYSGAAWLGKTLPQNPGSLTFMYKTLSGVPGDILTASARSNVLGKNGSVYEPVAGINITEGGVSGGGEFLDITWGTDALQAQIQIDVFALLASTPKVPYTDLGVDMISSVVRADLELFATPQFKFLVPGTLQVNSKPVAQEPTATRAARNYPDITFQANLQGAIHNVTIRGVLLV